MDVAAVVEARAADVAAFSTTLFRSPSLSTSGSRKGHTPTLDTPRDDVGSDNRTRGTWRAPRYRRPASDNIPVSRVVPIARQRAKKARARGYDRDTSDARAAAKLHVFRGIDTKDTDAPQQHKLEKHLTRIRVKQYHRRVLPENQWALLLKRRNRLWQRRRPLAMQRRCRRQATLRKGKQVRLCACFRARASRTPHNTRPTLTWLPSHARLAPRFHMRAQRVTLPPDTATHNTTTDPATPDKVRVAVAYTSCRKRHRMLQRWSALAGRSVKRVGRVPAQRAPPAYLVADTSQSCVYSVQPRHAQTDAVAATGGTALQDMAAVLGLVPEGTDATYQAAAHWSSQSYEVGTPAHVAHRTTIALHGHMRSALRGRVVPVTLVVCARHQSHSFYLLAAAPVRFPDSFHRSAGSFQARLVSLWTPCGAVDQFACAWEWWAPTATSESNTVLRRLLPDALTRCTRRRKPRPSASRGATHSRQTAPAEGSKRGSWRQYDLFLCPAWSSTQPRGPAACTVILVQHHTRAATRGSADGMARRTVTAAAPSPRASWQARRDLFRTARLFLGSLLGIRHLQCVAPVTARSHRMRVQLIGSDDRCTLRHLLGRPSFPHDFHPSAPLKSTRVPRHGALTLRRAVTTYGTPQNGATRLVVGADRADRRLEPSHAQPGCLFVRLRWVRLQGLGSVLSVDKIGVVTTAPFFVHRLGRSVVLVWCLYPCATGGWHGETGAADTDGLLALLPSETLAQVERDAEDAVVQVKRRRMERRRQKAICQARVPAGVAPSAQEDAGALLLTYDTVARILLDESACTFAKCFPIYE